MVWSGCSAIRKINRIAHLRIIAIAVALLSFSGNISAQRPHFLPDKVGVWKPFRMSCDGSGHALTNEQNRIYASKLQKLSEAVHQSQVFNPPMGVEARPTGCVNATIEFLDDYPGNRTGPIPGYLMIGTFSYAYYAGTTRVVVADEGPHFFVDVNSLMRLYSDAAEIAHDEDGKIFPLAANTKSVQGFPFYNGSIVITKVTRPIFLPVSAEQVLQAKIHQARTELAKAQADHHQQAAEFDRWVANRDKRHQAREITYQRLMISNPQGAAKYLHDTEEIERKQEERLKAEAANAGVPSVTEQFRQKELNSYETELASLSPAQRVAQAWYNWGRPYGSRFLADPTEPKARPLARFNTDFFDRSRPRTDIQVLIVGRLYGDLHESDDPQYQRLVDFRRSFNFQTLVSFLDQ